MFIPISKKFFTIINYSIFFAKFIFLFINRHFTCEYCRRKFRQKSSIEIHLLRHLNERPYNCELCQKRFVTKSSLQQHLRNMHDKTVFQKKHQKTYRCSYCSKTFNQKSNVKIHEIQKHEPEKMQHQCFCGKSFATSRGYQIHFRTHLPDEERRKFVCHICDKTLMSNDNLEVHMKIHDENRKRIECTLCRSDFVNNLTLKRHMREVHLKIKRKVAASLSQNNSF